MAEARLISTLDQIDTHTIHTFQIQIFFNTGRNDSSGWETKDNSVSTYEMLQSGGLDVQIVLRPKIDYVRG